MPTSPYDSYLAAASARTGVPIDVLKRQLLAESSGNPNAVSDKGATGLMQLLEPTAQDLYKKGGYTTPFDLTNPELNINLGADYDQQLLQRYHGNLNDALSAYVAGPSPVDSGAAANYPAVKDYLTKVNPQTGQAEPQTATQTPSSGIQNLLQSKAENYGLKKASSLFDSAPAASSASTGGEFLPGAAGPYGGLNAEVPVGSAANGGTILADGTISGGSGGAFSLSGIGSAGNAFLPAAGALGAYDVLSNQRHGASGALEGAASGAAIGSFFGPEGTIIGGVIGGGVGYFGNLGDENRFQDEGKRVSALRDKGTYVPQLSSEGLQQGRSPEQLAAIAQATGDAADVKFATSRDLNDLKGHGQSIVNYSAFAENDPNWFNKPLDERIKIANIYLDTPGAVNEHHGQIDINPSLVAGKLAADPQTTDTTTKSNKVMNDLSLISKSGGNNDDLSSYVQGLIGNNILDKSEAAQVAYHGAAILPKQGVNTLQYNVPQTPQAQNQVSNGLINFAQNKDPNLVVPKTLFSR